MYVEINVLFVLLKKLDCHFAHVENLFCLSFFGIFLFVNHIHAKFVRSDGGARGSLGGLEGSSDRCCEWLLPEVTVWVAGQCG